MTSVLEQESAIEPAQDLPRSSHRCTQNGGSGCQCLQRDQPESFEFNGWQNKDIGSLVILRQRCLRNKPGEMNMLIKIQAAAHHDKIILQGTSATNDENYIWH